MKMSRDRRGGGGELTTEARRHGEEKGGRMGEDREGEREREREREGERVRV